MHHRTNILKSAALLAAIGASAAHADVITLRRGAASAYYPSGYAGAADSTIFFYSAPVGHAAHPNVWMRTADGAFGLTRAINGPTNERALYRFDLSGMTGQGIDVTGPATITLYGSGTTNANLIYQLYEIASANAGWVESTRSSGLNPTTAAIKANTGDPTWWYKSINASLPATATIDDDANSSSPSVPWASMQVARSLVDGSNPEGYANTGGLWNWIDLVDQNLGTVANSFATMNNMDPVASSTYVGGNGPMTFTIPEAIIQSWIDNPSANAGLLGRTPGGTSLDVRTSEASLAFRPSLTFNFVVVPEAGGWALALLAAGVGGVAAVVRRRR